MNHQTVLLLRILVLSIVLSWEAPLFAQQSVSDMATERSVHMEVALVQESSANGELWVTTPDGTTQVKYEKGFEDRVNALREVLQGLMNAGWTIQSTINGSIVYPGQRLVATYVFARERKP